VGFGSGYGKLPHEASPPCQCLFAICSPGRLNREHSRSASRQLAGQRYSVGIVIFLTLRVAALLGRFGPFWSLPAEVLPLTVAGIGNGLRSGRISSDCTRVDRQLNRALAVGGLSLVLASLIAAPHRQR
jgi:hypothetical protein